MARGLDPQGEMGRLGLGPVVQGGDALFPEALQGSWVMDGATNVVQVSAGGYHSAITTAGGSMYTFGLGNGGRLGHGEAARDESEFFPRRVDSLRGFMPTEKTAMQLAKMWESVKL